MKVNRTRQLVGFAVGGCAGLLLLVFLMLPSQEALHKRGPMNKGHEGMRCASCHKRAPGSFRQQVQANIRFILGRRESPADIGHRPVGNTECLDCHERPNDRHPVFRFFEPRFKEARANIQPTQCASCHREHSGKLATIQPTFCVNCHSDLIMKKDPLTTPHHELIQSERWETCLGCHDFHGNHPVETPTAITEALAPEKILDYFNGGISPYGTETYYQAKKEAFQ